MQYDLVFEGGGAKGMAFVGAMREFEAAGHTIGRLIGSSAGAITAASLAAGYQSAEMLDALNEKAGDQPIFAAFLGDPAPPPGGGALGEFIAGIDWPLLPGSIEKRLDRKLLEGMAGNPLGRNLLSFFEWGGFFTADPFVEWFRRKLDQPAPDGRPRGFGRMSFAEMHAATGIDLSLTASDVTNNRLRILNHRTTPDLPVVWGTRMSMSLPLLWQEVVWREEWGPYRAYNGDKPVEIALAGSVMVDGGLLSNFPIELLVSREPMVRKIMGPDIAGAVAGFLIDESLPVPNAPPPPAGKSSTGLGKLSGLRTTKRLKGLVDTVTQAHDKMVIDENRGRVVRLPARGYGTTEFAMDADRRDALIAAAAAVTKDYFAQAAGELESLESLATYESDRIALGLLAVD